MLNERNTVSASLKWCTTLVQPPGTFPGLLFGRCGLPKKWGEGLTPSKNSSVLTHLETAPLLCTPLRSAQRVTSNDFTWGDHKTHKRSHDWLLILQFTHFSDPPLAVANSPSGWACICKAVGAIPTGKLIGCPRIVVLRLRLVTFRKTRGRNLYLHIWKYSTATKSSN